MSFEQKHCLPCEGIGAPLDALAAETKLKELAEGWLLSSDAKSIFQDFRFKNYFYTMAFVNAISWIAHLENHHPDLEVGYNHCLVRFSTHAIGGLSINDFICAAKVDVIFKPYAEKFYDRK